MPENAILYTEKKEKENEELIVQTSIIFVFPVVFDFSEIPGISNKTALFLVSRSFSHIVMVAFNILDYCIDSFFSFFFNVTSCVFWLGDPALFGFSRFLTG